MPQSLIPDLLAQLSASSRPALVQYDAGRVELSGKVLAQWAYKSANLFLEEGIGTGDVVSLDLPVHWRAVPFALGAWLQGAAVATTAIDGVTALVTDRPEAATTDTVIAVPDGALALGWDGPALAPGVLDGAADVAAQADLPLMPARPEPSDLAYKDAGIRFGDLASVIGTGTPARLGVAPSSVWELLRVSVAQWRAGGSVVVVSGLEPDAAEQALAQEGAQPRE